MFGTGFLPGLNFDRMNLTSEAIDKLLNDPKTTVEDLLKEEELLQEFRSQNEKLINFFDKDKIKHLLDYIIKEQEDEQNKGYKFPFLCSQIFGLEIDKIMKYFFITNKQLEEENKDKEKDKENEDNKEENKDEKKDNEEEKKEENKENDIKENEDKKEENKKDVKKVEEKKEGDENKEELKKEEESKKEEEQKKVDEPKKEEEPKNEGGENKKEEEPKTEEEPKKEEAKKEGDENKEEPKKEEDEEKKEEGEDENKEGGEEENEEEKSEPESKENKIELLDYFFEFLPEESDIKLNYVLSGYFSSLVMNLLSVNPTTFLKYIFIERREVLDRMVTHCYRKSISDTLSKLLHFENFLQNDPLDEETKNEMVETRNYLLQDIFDKIDINMDNEYLNSIYFFITGLFDPNNINEEKDIFTEVVDNKRIMRALITKTFHDLDLINYTEDNYEQAINRRRNFCVIIDIILFFLINIKKLKLTLPTSTSDSKFAITHTKLSEEVFNNLGLLIKNNFNKRNNNEKTISQSFNECKIAPLGEYKIKIVDLLYHLIPYFKNISKFYDEILIDCEFFKYAFDYLYEYEWNNIYQDSFLSLLRSLLNEANDHELLQEYLFNNLKIVDIIKNHTKEADKLKLSEDALPISHGYYSFFISLSYKLNTVMGGTTVIMQNGILRQGSFTFIRKVPEEGDKQGAMDMLYGGFEDVETNDKKDENKEKEEKTKNYESMEKYKNDDWITFFEENIVKVITQYEDKDWPPDEGKNKNSSPFDRASDNDNEVQNEHNDKNEEDEGDKKEKNIFGDDEDEEDKNLDIGRPGVGVELEAGENFFAEENNENEKDKDKENDEAFKENDINVDAFEFDDKNENKEEKKEEENPINKDVKENDFEFENEKKGEDIKLEYKDKENKEEKEEVKVEGKKEEEVKDNLNKEEKIEEPKKEEEIKEESKKEEEKKEEEQKLEEPKKEEEKVEEPKKEEEKVEEPKKEEVKKVEEQKVEDKKEEPNKEEPKKEEEAKVNKTEDKKEVKE